MIGTFGFILPLMIPLVPIYQTYEWKTIHNIADYQRDNGNEVIIGEIY